MRISSVGIGIVLFALGLAGAGPKRVTVVYDGDTFRTADSSVVRLLGIDAPESYQPGGDIAREILDKYVDGRDVRLEADAADKDQYGRLLRYVYVGDTMVNLEMVRKGFAAFRMFQATLKYKDTLARAEEEAARTGKGLWSFNVFTPPSIELLKEKVRAESLKADSGKPGLTVISWLDAASYMGRLVTVDGTVVATYNSGTVCHLNFHEDYRKYFSVVIFGQDLARFPSKPEDYYLKRHVRVTGVIKDYKGAPEIAVSDSGQIQVLK